MDEERLELLRRVVRQEGGQGDGGCGGHLGRCAELRVALTAQPGGLAAFEIVGINGNEVVFAVWDGGTLIMSEKLYECAVLPAAWKRLAGGINGKQNATEVLEDPRRVAMLLVDGVEHIVRIEYAIWCECWRRMRTWFLERPCQREEFCLAGS